MGENKVEYGLCNVHYAILKEVGGQITYESPVPIKGAVSLESEPVGESSKFYADNMVYYVATANQGYESTLTIASIPQVFALDILGEKLDATDGVQHEIADAVSVRFALLFQFEGDKKATRHVLYNCTANRPKISGKTKEEGTEVEPNELSLTASPLELDDMLLVKTKTTGTTNSTVYDEWFDKVYRKTQGA